MQSHCGEGRRGSRKNEQGRDLLREHLVQQLSDLDEETGPEMGGTGMKEPAGGQVPDFPGWSSSLGLH